MTTSHDPLPTTGMWSLFDWHEFSLLLQGDEQTLRKLEQEAERASEPPAAIEPQSPRVLRLRPRKNNQSL